MSARKRLFVWICLAACIPFSLVGLSWLHVSILQRSAVHSLLRSDADIMYEAASYHEMQPGVAAKCRRCIAWAIGHDFVFRVEGVGICCEDRLDLSTLQRLSRVRRIALSDCSLFDADLYKFREFHHLDFLDISDNQSVNGAFLSHLQGSKIVTLDLRRTSFDDVHAHNLTSLSSLRELMLDSTSITDVGVEEIAKCACVERLSLNQTAVGDDACVYLCAMPCLEVLRLQGTSVTDAGLRALAKLRTLKRVELLGTQVTPVGLDEFRLLLPSCSVNSEHVQPAR